MESTLLGGRGNRWVNLIGGGMGGFEGNCSIVVFDLNGKGFIQEHDF